MSEGNIAEGGVQMAGIEFPYALPQATRRAIILGHYVDANHGSQTRAVVFGSELDFRFVADSRKIEIWPRMSLTTLADMPFAEHPVPDMERIGHSLLSGYIHLARQNGATPFHMINVYGDLELATERAAKSYAQYFSHFNEPLFFDTARGMGSALNDFYTSLTGESSRPNPTLESMPLQIEELAQIPEGSWLTPFGILAANSGFQPAPRPVASTQRSILPQPDDSGYHG